MSASMVLVLALLIGVVCGLRSLTGPALVVWAVHFGWLHLAGSHLAFLANPLALVIFTVLAVFELIGDKTAKIPRRTLPGPLIWRLLMGCLCGAAFAVAGNASLAGCCILGALGALIGTYAGYWVRRTITSGGKLPDLPVALIEDVIAIGGGLFLVSRF
jgi:uncharacterized membrane protein